MQGRGTRSTSCARPLEAAAPAVRQGQRHDADADVVRADALSIARSALAPEPGHLVVGRVAYRREVLMQRLLHRVADHLTRFTIRFRGKRGRFFNRAKLAPNVQ